MTTNITVPVKVLGESVTFDRAVLAPSTIESLLVYGFKQWINDGAAVDRKKFEGTDDEFIQARKDGALDRINRIRTGDMPSPRGMVDEAKKRAQKVVAEVAASGVDLTKINPEKLVAWLKRQESMGVAA